MTDETFDLCRKVYEATSWGDVVGYYEYYPVSSVIRQKTSSPGNTLPTLLHENITPLYTSDYLLERLPATIGKGYWKSYLRMSKTDDGYAFAYMDRQLVRAYECTGSTPLIALLRLVLELKKEGII